jgi:hypothetical protein
LKRVACPGWRHLQFRSGRSDASPSDLEVMRIGLVAGRSPPPLVIGQINVAGKINGAVQVTGQ